MRMTKIMNKHPKNNSYHLIGIAFLGVAINIHNKRKQRQTMTLTVQVKSFIQHVFRLVSELMLIPIITWLSGRDKNTVERHSKSVELEDEACTTLMIDGSDATTPATAEEDSKAQARRRRRKKRLSTAKEVPRLLLFIVI